MDKSQLLQHMQQQFEARLRKDAQLMAPEYRALKRAEAAFFAKPSMDKARTVLNARRESIARLEGYVRQMGSAEQELSGMRGEFDA